MPNIVFTPDDLPRVGYVLLGDDVAAQCRYDQAKCAVHMRD